ncbi:hypothetical protein JNB62_16725 [Microbacterium jejuense]|uniref:DUF3618 domain-containing protein n=1 Tax=Microbacterium jejuense TaxID=1263637 RepID=A0ABS7HQT3_9MICO|nr:hypothetical protein [Microbacterium jejuense]MBW9095329.1 hypothetical protein [Microbacterium jejuense]
MYVAGVAVDEAVDTARDAKEAARGFFEETRTQLADQAAVQQRRAADALRGTGDELEGLANGATSGGAATDAVRMIGQQTRRAADWLEQRQPADVVGEVRRYARRHTVAFVITSFAVGIVAGRLTRALVSDAHDSGGSHDAALPAGGGTRNVTGAGTGTGTAPAAAAPASTPRTGAGGQGSSPDLGMQADAGMGPGGDTPIADALGHDARTGDTGDAWSPSGGARP